MEIQIPSLDHIHEAASAFIEAIVNEYLDGNEQPIYHFDFYRIKKAQEVLDIGFEDYIYSGCLCLMEWPEYIDELLPEETLKVSIEENQDGSRTITINN